MSEEDINDTPRSGITGEPEPLTEKALREASPAIEVFGEALVKNNKINTWIIVICVELIWYAICQQRPTDRIFTCSELLLKNLRLKFDLGYMGACFQCLYDAVAFMIDYLMSCEADGVW